MQARRMPRLAAALVVVLGLVGAGSASAAPREGSYVGRVQHSKAFVAFVVGRDVGGDRRVRALVSDSTTYLNWFHAGIHGGSIDSRSGGLELSGSFGEDAVTGSLRLDTGRSLKFAAHRVSSRGRAGLYDWRRTLDGRRLRGGWIVLPGGAQRGGVRGLDVFLDRIDFRGLRASIRIPGAGSFPVRKVAPS